MAQRQLDLFRSAQSAWQTSIAALERFEIASKRAQVLVETVFARVLERRRRDEAQRRI